MMKATRRKEHGMSTVSTVLKKKGGETLSVCPESTVFDAISMMAERSAGTVLVMDGDRLVGILSERDFIRKVYLKNQCGKGVKVKEIMSTGLTTVTPDEKLETCMTLMTNKMIRHLPVVDDGVVKGILSMGDIVKYLVTEKDFELKNLQNYISGPGL
jgi:CBS domain-containing protein